MTVSSEGSRIRHTADGTAGPWSFPYLFLADDDLKVVVYADSADTTKTLTTHYTVSGAGTASGSVTFTSGNIPDSGDIITIYRDEQKTQTFDPTNGDPLDAASLESAFDRIVMMVQRVNSRINRTPQLRESSSLTNVRLPDPVAGRALVWNTDADELENSGSSFDAIVEAILLDAHAPLATAAALQAATVPDDVEYITILSYNGDGKGFHRRKKVTDGTTQTGDLLSSDGKRWRCFTVEVTPWMFGATELEGTTAINNALEYLGSRREGVLYLEGRTTLDDNVSFSMPSHTADNYSYAGVTVQKLTIRGDGMGASVLVMPTTNITGRFRIITTQALQAVEMRDFSLLSELEAGATTGGNPHFHEGLTLSTDIDPDHASWGSKKFYQGRIERVQVTGTNGSRGQWRRPIWMEYMWRGIISDCYVTTECDATWDQSTNKYIPNGDTSGTSSGITMLRCYDGWIMNNQVDGRWLFGVHYYGEDQPDNEDGRILNNTVAGGCRDAIRFAHTNAGWDGNALLESGGQISGNHAHGKRLSIVVVNTSNLRITDNYLYGASDTQGDYLDSASARIKLDNCADAVVQGNQFLGDGFYVSDANSNKNIWLAGDTGSTNGCRFITIGPNQHGTEGVGIYYSSGTEDYEDTILIHPQSWGQQKTGTVGSAWTPTTRFASVLGTAVFRYLGERSGTSTPDLSFGGASTGITYDTGTDTTFRQVKWWANGTFVMGTCDIRLTSKGTATGDAVIDLNIPGLPDPASNTDFGITVVIAQNFATSAQKPNRGLITNSGVGLIIDGTGNADDADFTNTSIIRFSFFYRTA